MQKIDAKYFQSYRPTKREDKDFRKNKFIYIPLADAFNTK